jgi:hypothetical protein
MSWFDQQIPAGCDEYHPETERTIYTQFERTRFGASRLIAPLNMLLGLLGAAMVSVKWSELIDAFEFASFGFAGESQAFIDLDTGSLHCVADGMELEEEIPADLETSERYLALPHKNDLDLGRRLALSFAEQRLPGDFNRVSGYFRKRGAYSRFKELLDDRGVLEEWYAFEKDATERALRKWCDAHEIRIVPDPAAHL